MRGVRACPREDGFHGLFLGSELALGGFLLIDALRGLAALLQHGVEPREGLSAGLQFGFALGDGGVCGSHGLLGLHNCIVKLATKGVVAQVSIGQQHGGGNERIHAAHVAAQPVMCKVAGVLTVFRCGLCIGHRLLRRIDFGFHPATLARLGFDQRMPYGRAG